MLSLHDVTLHSGGGWSVVLLSLVEAAALQIKPLYGQFNTHGDTNT